MVYQAMEGEASEDRKGSTGRCTAHGGTGEKLRWEKRVERESGISLQGVLCHPLKSTSTTEDFARS